MEKQNQSTASSEHFKPKMLTDTEFNKLARFIFEEYGIKMPLEKKVMLQSRLQKRLRHLNMTTFKEYIEYVFNKEGKGEEVIHMIDVVSTNKTDFYREADHFEFLKEEALPDLCEGNDFYRPIKIWSAGCSSGEEPYTLAFTLSDYQEKEPRMDYTILGTDISSRILRQANDAIYKEEKTTIIPMPVKKKYLLKSKDRGNPTVRVKAEIRKKVSFQRLNFMDESYAVPDTYDLIFCRNVLIYFSREVQELVINKLCQKLRPGGYFFLGHSESITNMNVPLDRVKPTIFKRKS